MEFRNALKNITVAQFLKTSMQSSYDEDDSEYLFSYLDYLKTPKPTPIPDGVVVVNTVAPHEHVTDADLSALYYIAGMCVYSSLSFHGDSTTTK